MSIYDKNKSRFFQRIVDIGAEYNFSITELRYLRVTNIASLLGVVYNVTWMLIALFLTDALIIYGSNTFLGLMFLMALIFNWKGLRVLASVWLILASYMSVLLFLYLLGFSSGVGVVCFLIIILPYMTFPRKARNIAHVFSILACLTLIATVIFQSNIKSHFGGLDPYISQIVNISITALICFILIASMSILIDQSEESLMVEQKKSDDLLHNILPANIIRDLKESGKTIPKRHKNITVLFTDFEGFTNLVASMSAITLVNELNDIFGRFDEIMEETKVEKIETIGDAYMAACGLEKETINHATNCIKAAQKMLSYLEERNQSHVIKWRMRVGIHSGSVVAGVVGKKKFAYDLFGDTINTASRMESAGEVGKINISSSTYKLIKNEFSCISRGKIHAKGKGKLDMYFLNQT
ncbi:MULTISPECIES: adenylate/guanylate cyclase domain-containing protein [Winogradskyella]|jgi:class 3 adenylate cyclase|uniref:adenylate cyclase n=2 Tax=Winogradskyella TaxID=286104 RepID=A0ABT7ZVJ4_9FLAO|nr:MULTISPECIES: adenylate/guanylate cyclase domain-containing protein [Winogradskyella]MBC3844923.1 adenylate/guanylate cyclase domain-containing protein [Winogradskyella echinorum]MBC5749271.1 adenylate/guanylate cyclase domain-containing protein [Winogradskyella echinorum]MDN3492743.1 adenylate/guanylate cyclase domain-containing protein [Winogradskyella bathintestinalis]